MASIVVDDRDTNALPAALLALVKSHLRINTDSDDDYIQNTVARAIGWFEGEADVLVNPVTLIWTPDAIDFCNGRAVVPASPVSLDDWAVSDGLTDISDQYAVTTMSTKGSGTYALEGSFVTDMIMTFDGGFWSVDDLPAGILNAVLLYTSHLYENREILVPGSQALTPLWMTNVIAPWWRPRV